MESDLKSILKHAKNVFGNMPKRMWQQAMIPVCLTMRMMPVVTSSVPRMEIRLSWGWVTANSLCATYNSETGPTTCNKEDPVLNRFHDDKCNFIKYCKPHHEINFCFYMIGAPFKFSLRPLINLKWIWKKFYLKKF